MWRERQTYSLEAQVQGDTKHPQRLFSNSGGERSISAIINYDLGCSRHKPSRWFDGELCGIGDPSGRGIGPGSPDGIWEISSYPYTYHDSDSASSIRNPTRRKSPKHPPSASAAPLRDPPFEIGEHPAVKVRTVSLRRSESVPLIIGGAPPPPAPLSDRTESPTKSNSTAFTLPRLDPPFSFILRGDDHARHLH
jgi:hypothetical protein